MVYMKILPMILYSIFPLLGQAVMRAIELGGSLSRSWLLYVPVFWIFPFSIIPVVLARTGYVKAANNGSAFDKLVIITIVAKLLLSFIQLDTTDLLGMYIILLIGSMLITNTIHILTQPTCKTLGSNFFTVFIRALSNSCLQYSVGFILTFIIKFILKLIPVVKILAMTIREYDIPYKIIIFLLWAMGFVGAYMIINMIDNNIETPESYCKKSPKIIKMIIGFILCIGIIIYEVNK